LSIIMALIAGAVGFRFWSERQTRARLLATALPEPQRAIVDEQVPLTRKLPAELRRKLEGNINLFMNQIEFIGCNDLVSTAE
jgi:MtfA peptidase